MRVWFRRKGIQMAGIVLLVAGIAGSMGVFIANAVFDDTEAVHIVSDEIEEATLVIGTHLIYIGSLTDEIYAIAEESEAESNQYNRYYKSELSGGTWYDITAAASLADITTSGLPVSKEEIEGLFFTHHTRSDGQTYDLRTGQAVCIYDIENPYALDELDELEALQQQYKNLQEKTGLSETDKADRDSLKELLEKNPGDEKTAEFDRGLSALQLYLNMITLAGADAEQISEVQAVMKALDAARRAAVLEKLSETELEGLLIRTEAMEQVNYDLLSAVGTCIDQVENSLTEKRADMLAEGSGILSRVRYRLRVELTERANDADYTACDEAVRELVYLSRIEAGSIAGKEGELKFIEEVLIPEADDSYYTAVCAGPGDEYQAASASGATAAVLNQILKTRKNELETIRAELQFILQAELDRLTNETAQSFVRTRLSGTDNFREAVLADAFSIYAEESIDEYEEWLTGRLQNLLDSCGQNELDKLIREKEELLTRKLQSLDKNDLAEAKRLDALILVKDEEIADREEELTGIIRSPSASTAEKAEAAAKLGTGSSAANINLIKDDLINSLRDGNYNDLTAAIDGIDAMMQVNPDTALAAMQDIYKELAKQAYLHNITDASGSGTGSADGRGMTQVQQELLQALESVEDSIAENADIFTGKLKADDILDMLEAELGNSFTAMDFDRQAAAILAVEMYGQESGDNSILTLAASMAERAAGNGNTYLYDRLKNESSVFVPLENIGKCMGYRYLFSDSRKQGILQKGNSYYIFQAFGAEVIKQGQETDFMVLPAGYQSGIYIPLAYASETFGCEAEYLRDSAYGVMFKADIKEQALGILDMLLNNGVNYPAAG